MKKQERGAKTHTITGDIGVVVETGTGTRTSIDIMSENETETGIEKEKRTKLSGTFPRGVDLKIEDQAIPIICEIISQIIGGILVSI